MKKLLRLGLIVVLAPIFVACGSNSAPMHHTEFVDAETSAQPFFTGRREFEPLPYQLPEVVRERESELAPSLERESQAFTVKAPKFVIDVDRGTMTFDFDAVSKAGEEHVRLAGKFNKKSAPWMATLYAVDNKVLNEKRVQAVALCLTPHVCDSLGIDVYYKVENEILKRQLLTKVSGPRIPMAGDSDEDEVEEAPAAEVTPPAPASPGSAPAPVLAPPAPEPAPGPTPAPPPSSQPPPAIPPASAPPAVSPTPSPVVTTPAESSPQPSAQLPRPARPKASILVSEVPPEQLKDKPIEFTGKMVIPPPERSKFQMPGVEKITPPIDAKLVSQAIGEHSQGRLQQAKLLPLDSGKFIYRDGPKLKEQNVPVETWPIWTTDRMTDLLLAAGQKMAADFPGTHLYIGDIARRMGGKLAGHLSHQTGLDVDIGFFVRSNANDTSPRFVNVVGAKQTVIPDFDFERNWRLFKVLNEVRKDQVMVVFVHEAVKKAMCAYVRKIGEPLDDPKDIAFIALRSLVAQNDHYNHGHVRVYCPQTMGCTNKMVSLPSSNGCR